MGQLMMRTEVLVGASRGSYYCRKRRESKLNEHMNYIEIDEVTGWVGVKVAVAMDFCSGFTFSWQRDSDV